MCQSHPVYCTSSLTELCGKSIMEVLGDPGTPYNSECCLVWHVSPVKDQNEQWKEKEAAKGLGHLLIDHLIPVGNCLRQNAAASKHHLRLKKRNKICCSKTCLPSFLSCIINYLLTTPKVWPRWNHTDYGAQVGYKCGFEIAMTSADLAEKYAAVLVERHETVKNYVLKITVLLSAANTNWSSLQRGNPWGKRAPRLNNLPGHGVY